MSTWLLIEVDDISDVGVNELKRFKMSGKPIMNRSSRFNNAIITCDGNEVHPATKG